jgi:hypothetical protein
MGWMRTKDGKDGWSGGSDSDWLSAFPNMSLADLRSSSQTCVPHRRPAFLIADLRSSLADLRSSLADLRCSLADLRSSLAGLRSSLAGLRSPSQTCVLFRGPAFSITNPRYLAFSIADLRSSRYSLQHCLRPSSTFENYNRR